MKIYVIEYDSLNFSKNKVHNIKTYFESQLADLQEDLKHIENNPYVDDLKRYEGELKEVDKFMVRL